MSSDKHPSGAPGYEGGLTDVDGIRVGHAVDPRRPTGVTVVLPEREVMAGVDIRGSAPGTRETALLDPVRSVKRIHALVLSGGSAFGLDAASGVVRYLEERGVGYETPVARVPIVPSAILFDLALGDASIRPGPGLGRRACRNAAAGPVPEGNAGVGAGATVGKILGHERAMKGGLGSAAVRIGPLVVAALVAVNAVGDVIDPETGRILAGVRSAGGRGFADTMKVLRERGMPPRRSGEGENTTLGVIATNAAFDKAALTKIAQMSHDGLARAIRPVHMPADGDTLFALSTESIQGQDLGLVGALASQVTARAVVRAVLRAQRLPGYPCASDFL